MDRRTDLRYIYNYWKLICTHYILCITALFLKLYLCNNKKVSFVFMVCHMVLASVFVLQLVPGWWWCCEILHSAAELVLLQGRFWRSFCGFGFLWDCRKPWTEPQWKCPSRLSVGGRNIHRGGINLISIAANLTYSLAFSTACFLWV